MSDQENDAGGGQRDKGDEIMEGLWAAQDSAFAQSEMDLCLSCAAPLAVRTWEFTSSSLGVLPVKYE